MKVAISSGHSHRDPGAVGIFRERDENVKVADEVGRIINTLAGNSAAVYHDNTSTSSRENVNQTAAWHNQQNPDWNLQIHFNSSAGGTTQKPIGTETLYRHSDNQNKANDMSKAIALSGGFINRGPKHRTDLGFLNQTKNPALLIEVCFVNSTADEQQYRKNFTSICRSIAEAICK